MSFAFCNAHSGFKNNQGAIKLGQPVDEHSAKNGKKLVELLIAALFCNVDASWKDSVT